MSPRCESPGRRAQIPGRAAVWPDLDSLTVTVYHSRRGFLATTQAPYSSPGGFVGRQEMVLVSKSYLDVAGHPSWGWRARHGSEMIQQIYCRSTPGAAGAGGFTRRLPGRVPPGSIGKSRLSGCELVPRRGHVRDGRPLIGLIGARSPRFSRQFAVIGIAAVCITALVYT